MEDNSTERLTDSLLSPPAFQGITHREEELGNSCGMGFTSVITEGSFLLVTGQDDRRIPFTLFLS
jgi:hypothetical protein